MNTYEPINGGLTKQSFPAAGGLPAETVTYSTVGALDLPGVTGGNSGYAAAATYSAQSQPEQVTVGSGASEATVTYTYDPRTGALTDRLVQRSTTTPKTVDDTSYAYSPAGWLTSETDTHLGSSATSELQCFAYTTNGQLAQAWSAASSCSTVPTTSSFSTVGDGLGTSSSTTSRGPSTPSVEPHTKTSLVPSAQAFATTTFGYSNSTELTSAATAGASTGSASYTYNPNGEQSTRSPDGGQTLAWNNAGDLTGVTATSGGAQAASYVYDASGNVLTQTTGTKTTVYLPGEQLTIDTSASPHAVSGVRFYHLPGGLTAVRTGSGSGYGFEIQSDQHGTETLYLDSTAQVPTWRQFDPYGNPRGTAPTAGFPGSRGFLNDPADASTGLTNIGARWYDPATGTFASLDPVLDPASPLQLNGYTYASDNPVDGSDPTGKHQCADTCGGPGSGTAPGTGPSSPGGWQCGCGGGAPPPSSPPPSQAPPSYQVPGCGYDCYGTGLASAMLAGSSQSARPAAPPPLTGCGGMSCLFPAGMGPSANGTGSNPYATYFDLPGTSGVNYNKSDHPIRRACMTAAVWIMCQGTGQNLPEGGANLPDGTPGTISVPDGRGEQPGVTTGPDGKPIGVTIPGAAPPPGDAPAPGELQPGEVPPSDDPGIIEIPGDDGVIYVIGPGIGQVIFPPEIYRPGDAPPGETPPGEGPTGEASPPVELIPFGA